MRNKHATKSASDNQVVSRLDFNERMNFKTPIPNRKVPLVTSIDNVENETALDDQSCIMQKPDKVQTEDKGTDPIADWKSKDTEINSYKCKMTILNKQIDDINIKHSRIRIENEVKATKMKNEFDANLKLVTDLKTDLVASQENQGKLREELEKYKQAYLEHADAFEKQQLEYEKTTNQLKEELRDAKAVELEFRKTSASEILLLQHRVRELENELEMSNGEKLVFYHSLQEFKSKEYNNDALQKEFNSAKQQVQRLNDEIDSYKENARLQDILKEEIHHFQQVKNENVHLKNQVDLLSDVHEKNVILKERVRSFVEQIETLNQLINQKNIDLGELSYNKKRINEWVQIVGADTPQIVISQMNELKQSVALLRVENDSLRVDLQNKVINESFKESSSQSLEQKLKKSLQEVDQLSGLLKKLNRKCMLFEKQKESYKRLIDSYESEVTINLDDANRKRIFDLENIVSEYKSLLDTQEKDAKQEVEFAQQLAAKDMIIHELKSEIEQIKTLNPHVCTSMNLNVSTLQTRENNFRVIHLKANPLTLKINEYTEEYNNLKEENTRLKCLVEVLESGDVADMTRQINEGMQHRSEVERLKKKYESLDKRFHGLRDTFKKISKSFREICYYLTGFKIDNIANNRYKLTHAYDPHKRSLIFELNNKEINMLQDSSVSGLQDKIDTYLIEGASYPAFLAAFTLDLFQNSSNLSRSINWN